MFRGVISVNNKSGFRCSGMGVGYVSVMVIFVTVCLTLFAVLSLSAAGSDDAFNKRSGEYLQQYYAADARAQEILARMDETAHNAEEGLLVDALEAFAEEIGGEVSPMKGGCKVKYSVQINNRQELMCEVFFAQNGGFEKTRWQSVVISGDDESHPNVWDGNF